MCVFAILTHCCIHKIGMLLNSIASMCCTKLTNCELRQVHNIDARPCVEFAIHKITAFLVIFCPQTHERDARKCMNRIWFYSSIMMHCEKRWRVANTTRHKVLHYVVNRPTLYRSTALYSLLHALPCSFSCFTHQHELGSIALEKDTLLSV